jgi:hypothetical protein
MHAPSLDTRCSAPSLSQQASIDSLSLWERAIVRSLQRLACAYSPSPLSVVILSVKKNVVRVLYPVIYLVLLAALWGCPGPASRISTQPGEPPTAPVLRLETGMHTAAIQRIGIDEAQRYLVTGSDDKTVRVWELASGRLLRTLRPPIGAGNEGKSYAVALSPDGSTVAAAGWTGWDWDGTASIYLFDRASSRLRQRLTGLLAGIAHLAYSRDSAFLVATLGGTHGMRVYRSSDGAEVARAWGMAITAWGLTSTPAAGW